ncbi:MAG TPA: efflux transporter outer membrane subunit [Caldimonas sp.]|jgi:NodT family efflux transporter outer membrane factor (OMF) lipoprotein|nr:efflux transporter outer membrane subunit [Caldimonas sp.]HEV7577849.1 efflux transporter outer membrane subunit [Caldimonas sp.]
MKPDSLAATLFALALAGCAATGAGTAPAPVVASAWQAPLPHGGDVAALRRWWTQFDDPLLARLVDAAEVASPTIASAQARIAEARASRAAAGAALLPALDASANVGRGRQDVSLPSGTSESIGLQASWELDVFGRNQAARDAAGARVAGARATWHDARVVVAAETANQYLALRTCESLLAQARLDAASRAETARLTELSMESGFESRANAALTRASAAQGLVSVKQQGEQCEQAVKGLVALTGLAEPDLRGQLAAAAARLPEPATLEVPSVPAAALAQRPDVFARERDVAAASADIGEARAAQWPRITLAGSVGAGRFESGFGSISGTTWSIGPVAVSLPVFDAGARRANVVAARARYDEATSAYAATLRNAIRDVENALVALQGTADRRSDAQVAADNFEILYRATEARYKSGFGTLFELEDARRSALAAQNTLIDLRRERIAAWIALYRALGGGWSPLADERTAATSQALPASP